MYPIFEEEVTIDDNLLANDEVIFNLILCVTLGLQKITQCWLRKPTDGGVFIHCGQQCLRLEPKDYES